MKAIDAAQLLGLLNGEARDARAVKAAWARAVTYHHPDTRAACDDPAQGIAGLITIESLTKARDLLLSEIAGDSRACKFCRGTGKVHRHLGVVDCITCRGTGDKLP